MTADQPRCELACSAVLTTEYGPNETARLVCAKCGFQSVWWSKRKTRSHHQPVTPPAVVRGLVEALEAMTAHFDNWKQPDEQSALAKARAALKAAKEAGV